MKDELNKEIDAFIDRHIYSENFESPYFRNFLIGHYKTLKSTFRNVEKILGERVFKNLVMEFLFKHPPSNPDLNIYGDKFPHFLINTTKLDVDWISDLALIDYKTYTNEISENNISIPLGVMKVWESLETGKEFHNIEIDESLKEKWSLDYQDGDRYWVKVE